MTNYCGLLLSTNVSSPLPIVLHKKIAQAVLHVCFATIALSNSAGKTYRTRASFTFGNVLDSVKRYFCRTSWSISSARVLDIPPSLAASTRALGNRLEDNTLNASPLLGSNVRDVRNFRRRINPPFPRDIPGAESSKVSSDSTDVGRTCCLSCLSPSLSLAVPPLFLFAPPPYLFAHSRVPMWK